MRWVEVTDAEALQLVLQAACVVCLSVATALRIKRWLDEPDE